MVFFSVSDYNSVFSASTYMSLSLSICSFFASKTALCGTLERTGTFVCLIFNVLYIFLHCIFRFKANAGEPTLGVLIGLYHFLI